MNSFCREGRMSQNASARFAEGMISQLAPIGGGPDGTIITMARAVVRRNASPSSESEDMVPLEIG
jgi:hypothetical protein